MAKAPAAQGTVGKLGPAPEVVGHDINTLARLARCDVRTITQLTAAGIVVRIARGKYRVLESMGNMIVYYRERAAGRQGSDGTDPVKSNAAFKDSQRALNELKLRQLQGQVIDMSEVEQAWGALVQSTKQLILGLPARIRFDLPRLTGEDQEIIERTVRDALEEVSITGTVKLPPQKQAPDAAAG
jgi:phage terminase Nu1 subunit (DNA packaging protein)